MRSFRWLLVPAVALLAACGDGAATSDSLSPRSTDTTATTDETVTSTCQPGDSIPTPVVRSGESSVVATAGAVYFCELPYGLMHGDGPLVFGEEPVLLVADGDVVVDVAGEFAVELQWTGGQFTPTNGSFTADQPPVGCHRLAIDVSDPGSDNFGDFAVMVSVGDVDCSAPPPIEGFKLLGMAPTAATIEVGESVEVSVVIDVVNAPEGFFCPQGRVVEGTSVDVPDFVLGCTANGNGNALMEIVGLAEGTSVIEVTAITSDGTQQADGSARFTVTVTP